MALVKTSDLSGKPTIKAAAVAEPNEASNQPSVSLRRAQDRTRVRREKAAERIGAAIEELTAGLAEASSAAEELNRSLEQISSAAEEAAGAAAAIAGCCQQLRDHVFPEPRQGGDPATQERRLAGLAFRCRDANWSLGSFRRRKLDAPTAHGRGRHTTRAPGGQHRRNHEDRWRYLRPDKSIGAERRH